LLFVALLCGITKFVIFASNSSSVGNVSWFCKISVNVELWLLPSFPGSERVIPEKDDDLWTLGKDWSQ
jgi:hypothetical protein